jgi:hypothetical protein
MAIDLKFANDLMLRSLIQKTIFAQMVLTKKATGNGKRGQSVDVLVDALTDVAVKTYTEADKEANTAYVYDQFSMDTINVRLKDEIYAALELDGWDQMVVNAENISDLAPTINTIVNRIKARIENALGVLINGLTGADLKTVTFDVDATKEEKGKEILTALQGEAISLNTNGVASDARYAVLGRDAYLALVSTDALLHADKSDSPQALREAVVGRVAGFDVVVSEAVDTWSAVVFQQEAFGLISKAPGKHLAAVYSELASVPEAPIDLRVNIDGLAEQNSTGIIASTFFTVAQMVEEGATSNPRAKKLVFV